jgi:hypothetical protein
MPVYIPIVSEFKSQGVDKALKEFRSLEGGAAKASFAIKKAALPAAAALAGLGDQAAAEKLAGTLRNVTGASDKQIASVEDYISKTSVAAAVADDELRPALQTLITGTKDVTKAQDLMGLALDISAATGQDLETVSKALAKGYNGQNTALKKLDPSLGKLIKDGASTDEVFAALSETFGGQAAAAADTAEGKMKSMSIALGEAKEEIGAALLPVITTLAEKLTEIAQYVQDNSTLFLVLGGILGGLAIAVVAVNAALSAWAAIQAIVSAATAVWNAILAANPLVLLGIAIAAVIAALVVLQMKFNIFGKVFDGIKWAAAKLWEGIGNGFNWLKNLVLGIAQTWLNVFGAVFNAIAKAWNNTIGKLSFTIPSWVPVLGGKTFDVPDLPTVTVPNLLGGSGGGGSIAIPKMAEGGIVNSPTLALIGEAGPEAVVPLSRGMAPSINVTVNGALDPVAVATQIRKLLADDARRRGATFAL